MSAAALALVLTLDILPLGEPLLFSAGGDEGGVEAIGEGDEILRGTNCLGAFLTGRVGLALCGWAEPEAGGNFAATGGGVVDGMDGGDICRVDTGGAGGGADVAFAPTVGPDAFFPVLRGVDGAVFEPLLRPRRRESKSSSSSSSSKSSYLSNCTLDLGFTGATFGVWGFTGATTGGKCAAPQFIGGSAAAMSAADSSGGGCRPPTPST